MTKLFQDQIRDVVAKAVLKFGSAYALSKATGISQINISRWLRGTPPRSSDVAPIMAVMNADIHLPDEEYPDYAYLPKVAALAGAGASLATEGDTVGLYAFRRDWLGKQHISAENSILLDVLGDSMEPVFKEGDTLLVDKTDTDILDGRIYLITLGDELRVKHVQKTFRGLLLRSENPRYADVPVEGPDLEMFIVHGRVRWCGKLV